MGLFSKKKKIHVCVIGLDGVPYGLLTDLAQKDVMPHFRSLMESGRLQSMKASLPEISSVSWTDFMTGTNPGRHGIFGFTDFKPGSYDLRFPNFHDVQTATFWDELGAKDKRSIIINQPSTYPARKVHGVLISGFVAIEMSKAVYPLTYKPALEKLGYEIDIDTSKARENRSALWADLDRTLQAREKAFRLLWSEDWDFFEFIVTGTDRLHHFLWDSYPDQAQPDHQRFLDYYSQVDGLVQRITNAFEKINGSLDGLFLLSDHGFAGIKQEVYLNTWLQQQGFLSYDTESPQGLHQVSSGSKAFAMDPNRIYIHRRGRFPRGTVDETEVKALKEELAAKLAELEHDGEKVVRRVFDTDEIYSGPLTASGPDLIVLSQSGYDMKGSVKKREVFGRSNLQGMHTWDDAFFWSLQDRGPELAISDLRAIIMDYFS